MAISYALVGSMNSMLMVAVSWPVFILRTGSSPLLFQPFKFNPKFLLYLSAVYFSYGSICTPILLAASLGLARPVDWLLTWLQERLRAPKWAALGVLAALAAVALGLFFAGALLLSCLVFRTPVLI